MPFKYKIKLYIIRWTTVLVECDRKWLWLQNVEVEQNGVASDSEMEEFVHDLKTQVEIFVNRMKSNSSRGRSIANDSSVQKLFMNITAMHSKLLHYIQQQDDGRGW